MMSYFGKVKIMSLFLLFIVVPMFSMQPVNKFVSIEDIEEGNLIEMKDYI